MTSGHVHGRGRTHLTTTRDGADAPTIPHLSVTWWEIAQFLWTLEVFALQSHLLKSKQSAQCRTCTALVSPIQWKTKGRLDFSSHPRLILTPVLCHFATTFHDAMLSATQRLPATATYLPTPYRSPLVAQGRVQDRTPSQACCPSHVPGVTPPTPCITSPVSHTLLP